MLDETYVLRYDKPVTEKAGNRSGRRMENKRPETEEERRERVRRARARKEIHQQRLRRKKIIRLSVYILVGVLGVLLIAAVIAIVHRVQDSRAEQAVENAIQEEITNSAFYDPSQVLHLSFPVLSLDSAGSGLSVSQFSLILEDLYAGGYVLIDPYELAGRTEKGFAAAEIMVPAGKKPLILSQYDVSYEEGDTAHATALTMDASGRISCTYYDEYGSQITGAVDVVPVVEAFIESHPDFSYKGARGVIGVTGYRGVLGYSVEVDETPLKTVKIDRPVQSEEDLYSEDADYEEAYGGEYGLYGDDNTAGEQPEDPLMAQSQTGSLTDGNAEEPEETEEAAERKQAEETAQKNKETVTMLISTLRSGGWHIASNTFDRISYAASSDIVREDAEKWNTVIAPLAGTADILMLPEGADIGEWSGYSENNERYTILRDLGFRYFFVENEETSTWAQVRPPYVRQTMHAVGEYASYLSLMNSGEAASQPVLPSEEAEEPASDNQQANANGALELVGEALQPVGSGAQEDTSAGEISGEGSGAEGIPEEGAVTEETW